MNLTEVNGHLGNLLRNSRAEGMKNGLSRDSNLKREGKGKGHPKLRFRGNGRTVLISSILLPSQRVFCAAQSDILDDGTYKKRFTTRP